MSHKPIVVLDTNVLLDWLVFRDERVGSMARRILHGELAWIACPAMRNELVHMLAHPRLKRWAPDSEHALTVFDSLTGLQPDPIPSPGMGLRCTDPDDQVFVDLAITASASLLLTRDRALLKLRRRARALGLSIQTP